MAFTFDVDTALARARETVREHPKVPKVPKVGCTHPKTLGTLGTLGLGVASEFTDTTREERERTTFWLRCLANLRAAETDPIGLRAIAMAEAFIRNGWAAQATAFSWTEIELFGICPAGRWARLDRLGAAFSSFEPRAVCADRIVFSPALTLLRGAQADGAVLAWEVFND